MGVWKLMRSCRISISEGNPPLNAHQSVILLAVGQRLLEHDMSPFTHPAARAPSNKQIRRFRGRVQQLGKQLRNKLLEIGGVYRKSFLSLDRV